MALAVCHTVSHTHSVWLSADSHVIDSFITYEYSPLDGAGFHVIASREQRDSAPSTSSTPTLSDNMKQYIKKEWLMLMPSM